MKRNLALIFVVFIVCSCTNSTPPVLEIEPITFESALHWNWVDDFSDTEKEKIQDWIGEVYRATQKTMGQYPFDVFVYLHASSGGVDNPVSFGYATLKQNEHQVHFYVNPTAKKEDLLTNWIAPHELSHLAVPFIGKKNQWFTEGFATFFSRQIMMEMGQLNQAQFDSLYYDKIAETKKYYQSPTKTFIEVSDSLIHEYIYGSMYWGSTSFFILLDEQLRSEKGIRLIHVLQQYQHCCRLEDKSLKDILTSFDQIIGEPYCADLMQRFRTDPSAEIMRNF